jgi:hypothetical protein
MDARAFHYATEKKKPDGLPHVAYNGTGRVDWYTPSYLIEAARRTMGSIDTDGASSDIANKVVRVTT